MAEISSNQFNHPTLHETVVMPSADFPIKFFEYTEGHPGPYCGMHWHEHLEMIYVHKGVITTYCNASNFTCGEGDIILINGNELHGYALVETPIHISCVIIDLALLHSRYISNCDSIYLIPISQNKIQFSNCIEKDTVLTRYFESLVEENKRKEIGYEYAIKSSVYGMIAQLMRKHIKNTLSPHEYHMQNRNLISINKAISFIEENYTDNIDLDALSSTLGVTRFYFCRFFKEMTGSTPIDYLNNYRIHKSITLLTKSDTPITEIAMNVGFNDSNYFSRVFKNLIGRTPSQYRLELNAAQAADGH